MFGIHIFVKVCPISDFFRPPPLATSRAHEEDGLGFSKELLEISIFF